MSVENIGIPGVSVDSCNSGGVQNVTPSNFGAVPSYTW